MPPPRWRRKDEDTPTANGSGGAARDLLGRLSDLESDLADVMWKATGFRTHLDALDVRLAALEGAQAADTPKGAPKGVKVRKDSQGRVLVRYQIWSGAWGYRVLTQRRDPLSGTTASFAVGTWKPDPETDPDGAKAYAASKEAAGILADALRYWPRVSADQIVAAVHSQIYLAAGPSAVELIQAQIGRDGSG